MEHTDKIDQLKNLVSLFSANIAQYKSTQYDESNTRTDFIDKFFTLLDWDIANNQGHSETYRDVVREDKVKIDGSQKAPDYSFRIGGTRKFFVEAKKPSVNIKEAADPAYQVRRYAYTAKLPLSILTDFEEFAVYDTRIKPNKNDNAGTARIFYCTFDQYEQKFDFIYSTFSKDAILKGSFDKYVEENKNKKGTSEVDAELLSLVEEWRVELAKNIAKNNSNLSVYNLNTVVQRIIDRIVFLRIAEDKGIEDENLLLTVAKTTNIYEKLILLFTKANTKYNSGLFADVDWINGVHIDDKVLSNIIVNLYYPECPYEFSVLPVEILGSIYERFLGKTIRFRAVKGDTHTAIIEEKPEVKKAGGVYYTPQYIVDYIVKNTVGEKIKNKTPEEIASIKICDPACGSGSFLVGAYQYLLNYHLDYYTQAKNAKSALKNSKIYEVAFQSYKLTIEEKQRILTSTIFGVDIDSQAVEVTKLSLYLKLLENEGSENKDWLFKYSHLALLPSLEDNIKCGNSLIGTDFYAQGDLDFSDDDRIKINCFDWETGFAEIFKKGGFDVVIGNPPYGAGLLDKEKEYLKKYTCFEYQVNSFVLFIEKGINLLCNTGVLSFITPATFLAQHYFKKIRYKILNKYIEKIVVLNYKVFADADTGDTAIFVIANNEQKEYNFQYALINNKDMLEKEKEFTSLAKNECLSNERYEIKQGNSDSLLQRIISFTIPLNLIAICIMGIKPYQKGKGYPKQTEKTVKNRIFDSAKKTDNTYKPYLIGKDIDRYSINYSNKKYIKYGKWLAEPRFTAPFEKEKIIVRQTSDIIRAVIDSKKYYSLNNIYNIEITNSLYNYKYLLGILNSSLMVYIYQNIVPEKGKVFAEIKKVNLDKLPIFPINFSIKTEKEKHDKLVSLVDKMLELKQKEATEPNQQLKTMIARQVEGIDKAIDTAVYGLYNLTEDEIKVVERNEKQYYSTLS
jgi:type I restriction-modification system DNA methylase subunit